MTDIYLIDDEAIIDNGGGVPPIAPTRWTPNFTGAGKGILIDPWTSTTPDCYIVFAFYKTGEPFTNNSILFGGWEDGVYPNTYMHVSSDTDGNKLRFQSKLFGSNVTVNGQQWSDNALTIENNTLYTVKAELSGYASANGNRIEYIGSNFMGAEEFIGAIVYFEMVEPAVPANHHIYRMYNEQNLMPQDTSIPEEVSGDDAKEMNLDGFVNPKWKLIPKDLITPTNPAPGVDDTDIYIDKGTMVIDNDPSIPPT